MTNTPSSNFEEFDLWKHSYISDQKYSSPSVIINGVRGSGKTYFLEYLISQFGNRYFDKAYLISKTCKLQPKAYYYIHESNRYDSFSEEMLSTIIAQQKIYVQAARNLTSDGSIKDPKRILIVLDDIITDPQVRTSQALKDLYVSGRHLFITPITLCHSIPGREGLGPLVRQNSDFVICFNPAAWYDRQLISERWLSLKGPKEGYPIISQLTNERYQAMIILASKQADSREYTDYVYYKKAPETIKKIVLGTPKPNNPDFFGGTKSDRKGLKLNFRANIDQRQKNFVVNPPAELSYLLKNHNGT